MTLILLSQILVDVYTSPGKLLYYRYYCTFESSENLKKGILNRDCNRLRHQIELDQGFPKPVAKVPEVFGRGFYGHLKIDFFF